MQSFYSIICLLTVAFGMLSLSLFITRVITAEPAKSFAPFKSFPLMSLAGFFLVLFFLNGALAMVETVFNQGKTTRELNLQSRVDTLEVQLHQAQQTYKLVETPVYTRTR
jgi:hypothetical protein